MVIPSLSNTYLKVPPTILVHEERVLVRANKQILVGAQLVRALAQTLAEHSDVIRQLK